MRMSPEFYQDQENAAAIKQALAIASLNLFFPGQPHFIDQNFKTYITLEYHAALVNFYAGDIYTAIRFAEQARMDMLRWPDSSRWNLDMLPFYNLLAELYSAAAARKPNAKSFSDAYRALIERLPPAVVGAPRLPDLAAEIFHQPELQTVLVEVPPHEELQHKQHAKLQVELYILQACEFLGLETLGSLDSATRKKQLAICHRVSSIYCVNSQDFTGALIHGKRGEVLMLEFLDSISNNPNILEFYQTMITNLERIMAKTPDPDGVLAIEWANYRHLIESVPRIPGPGGFEKLETTPPPTLTKSFSI